MKKICRAFCFGGDGLGFRFLLKLWLAITGALGRIGQIEGTGEVHHERPVLLVGGKPGGVLEAESLSPQGCCFGVLCLIFVQKRREMGKTAIEMALNELKNTFLCRPWRNLR